MTHLPLLSLLVWLPILGGVFTLMAGNARPQVARWIALAFAIAAFAISIPLFTGFDAGVATMQFVEQKAWIPAYDIQYHLGADGISIALIGLTTLTTVLVLIGAWGAIDKRVSQYYAAFMILEGLMIGVFSALDALLFYVFFEGMLIPLYLIVGVWGGPNRVYAAFKFFLYTLAGSLLMLVSFVYLYYHSGGSFDIQTWHRTTLGMTAQTLMFFAFLLAFGVKVPMWPVHTWLPDAHVEAPTGGSVILAAIMLKLGAYGFLRFSLPITPDASHYLSGFMITLSMIAVIYIGLVALVQKDMKKLIAYSSIAHMGFVTLGFFLFNTIGMQGGLMQMISHGFVSAAMFLCIGVLYDRMHTRQIADYGGVINTMPKFAAFFIVFSMANCGLPGTSGFVGESLVIWGGIKINFWVGMLAGLALILGAAYSLWLVKRVIFGAVGNEQVKALKDVNLREFIMLLLLLVAVIAIGVYPAPITESMQTAVADLLRHVAISKVY